MECQLIGLIERRFKENITALPKKGIVPWDDARAHTCTIATPEFYEFTVFFGFSPQ